MGHKTGGSHGQPNGSRPHFEEDFQDCITGIFHNAGNINVSQIGSWNHWKLQIDDGPPKGNREPHHLTEADSVDAAERFAMYPGQMKAIVGCVGRSRSICDLCGRCCFLVAHVSLEVATVEHTLTMSSDEDNADAMPVLSLLSSP